MVLVARLALTALLIVYVAVIALSHSVALPSQLQAPLAFVDWLALVAVAMATYVLQRRRVGSARNVPEGRKGSAMIASLARPWTATVLFSVVAIAGLSLALSGDMSIDCPTGATTCVKIDNWKMSDGRYYRQLPYDRQGNSDPTQPWVEIDRATYISEVGTRLRMAAAFGVGALCFGWFVAGGLIPASSIRA